MSKPFFTPGPWSNYKSEGITAKGHSIEICQFDQYSELSLKERKANVRLIRAAPSMHKALSEIIRKLEPISEDIVIRDILNIATNGIKKV